MIAGSALVRTNDAAAQLDGLLAPGPTSSSRSRSPPPCRSAPASPRAPRSRPLSAATGPRSSPATGPCCGTSPSRIPARTRRHGRSPPQTAVCRDAGEVWLSRPLAARLGVDVGDTVDRSPTRRDLDGRRNRPRRRRLRQAVDDRPGPARRAVRRRCARRVTLIDLPGDASDSRRSSPSAGSREIVERPGSTTRRPLRGFRGEARTSVPTCHPVPSPGAGSPVRSPSRRPASSSPPRSPPAPGASS